jgi:predicted O-linked N-acetylglucosamine transferase (SPINDLY family)
VPDPLTETIKDMADHWCASAGLSDSELADQIRADRIDILIDLQVHGGDNRLLVFARKPAPVQLTMIGVPATTGLSTIDYRFTDSYLDPPASGDGDYTEQPIRLSHSYWCYPLPAGVPPVAALPALENGFVTFGCLNLLVKLSQPALELWVQVLRALPDARLLILADPGSHLKAVRAPFKQAGIADERIAFLPITDRGEYFAYYHQLDLGLDPFPYNGHTSTLDALWMGVPVVTLAGRTAVGRGGLSILSNAGLTELVAHTASEYVAIAVDWARHPERLAALRAQLRARMLASPLADAKLYAAEVEAAFRQMWQRWCHS